MSIRYSGMRCSEF